MNNIENKLRHFIREEIKKINEATLANDMYYRNLAEDAWKTWSRFISSHGDKLDKMIETETEVDPWVFAKKWAQGEQEPGSGFKNKKCIGVSGNELFKGGHQGTKISYGISSPNDDPTGGFFTHSNMFDISGQQGTIIIMVNLSGAIKRQLLSAKKKKTFIHEYTHFLDFAGDSGDVKNFSVKTGKVGTPAYYTDSLEWNTYGQEFQKTIARIISLGTAGGPGKKKDEVRFLVWILLGRPITGSSDAVSKSSAAKGFIKYLEWDYTRWIKDKSLQDWYTAVLKNPKKRKKLIKRLINLWKHFVKEYKPPKIKKGKTLDDFDKESIPKLARLVYSDNAELAIDLAVSSGLIDKLDFQKQQIKLPAGEKNTKHDTRGK